MSFKTPLTPNSDIPKLKTQDYLNIEKNVRNPYIGILLSATGIKDSAIREDIKAHVKYVIEYMRKLKEGAE